MNPHEAVLKFTQEMATQFDSLGIELDMPPNSIKTHKVVYTEIELGKSLTAEFSFDKRFTNPMKMYQGGFLCAAIDDVFGPLSYMAAKRPVVTVQMNTTFIRPFLERDKKILIKAWLVSQTKSLLVLEAEVKTADGKLIAMANSQSFIFEQRQPKE